jgi:hypothetical protein
MTPVQTEGGGGIRRPRTAEGAVDSWSGRMTLQNGPTVTFPQNFAFTQVPEVGQSAKLTYFVDQSGNNIGQSFDGATGR